MCGIVGGLNLTEDVQIQKALEKISHRGPDKQSLVKFGDNIFGHARLSIQDLSELGNQPMVSKCGRFIIVFNGEIYNAQSLIEEIPEVGKNLLGSSDTEILLEYIAHHLKLGTKLSVTLKKLNGIFAFAFLIKFCQSAFLLENIWESNHYIS